MNDESQYSAYSEEALLADLEKAIREPGLDFSDARKLLRHYLWMRISDGKPKSIAEGLEEISHQGRVEVQVADVLLRVLAVDQLLPPSGPNNQLDRHLVQIVERSLPKVCEYIGLQYKAQTFEKLSQLRNVHSRICEILEPLRREFQTIEGLLASRQTVLGALNHNVVKQYGVAFGAGPIRSLLERIFHDVNEVAQAKPSLLLDVEQCERSIGEGLNIDGIGRSFIYFDYLFPFLQNASDALREFIRSTRGRFSARISLALVSDTYLPKRYPLHEEGRQIQIRVPFRNSGPGLAIGVRADLSAGCDAVVLQGTSIQLGDVLPGEFSLVFDLLIVSPLEKLSVDVVVTWNQAGIAASESDIFSFKVAAQRADIDWGKLEYWHPYGIDPAKGDRFVGRTEAVGNLAGRLLRSPMDPFYITGQKRVGKTSLALACTGLLPVSRTQSLGVMMEPEVDYGTKGIQPRVQA